MQQPTRIYFDNAATTALDDEARFAMEPYFSEVYGNASSPYAVSRAARMALDKARGQVARLLGAEPDEIVFTSGGTESDNWALLGVALQALAGAANGRHAIVSNVEHPAVLDTAIALRELGFAVDEARCNGEGVVEPEEVGRLLRADTLLVSVMMVNNEVGTVQPVEQLAACVSEHSAALFHSDAVQAAGKLPVITHALGADMMSLSAHKFGGPKGAGALYLKRGTRLHPLLRGGGQERGRRAGTENVAAIVGMGAAAQTALGTMAASQAHAFGLRDRLERGLRALPGVVVNGAGAERSSNITNASFAGFRAESLALRLDAEGIAVGTGSACASGALEPSHVLMAMGLDGAATRAALRFSSGPRNTLEDVDELLEGLARLLKPHKALR